MASLNISTKDATITIVNNVFPTPVEIDGYIEEEGWDFGEEDNVEVLVGLDGTTSVYSYNIVKTGSVTLSPQARCINTFFIPLLEAQAVTPISNVLTILQPSQGVRWIIKNLFITSAITPDNVKVRVENRVFNFKYTNVEKLPLI